MDISQPHDAFFRLIVSKVERAVGLAQSSIPPHIARHLRFDTLTSEPESFVESHLKKRFLDALFSLQTQSGSPAFLYLLIDHKSSPDPDVGLQLLRYDNRIWDRYSANHPGSKLPPIVSIVIYHGSTPWNVSDEFKACFDCSDDFYPLLPQFRFILLDLSTLSEDNIHGAADLKAALMLMKYIFSPNLREYLPKIFTLLKAAKKQPDFLSFFEAFMLYLLKYLNQDHHEFVEQLVQSEFHEEGENIMPTVADKLREEGRLQGLEQGLEQGLGQGFEQGLEEGRRHLVKGIIRVLQVKFQEVPAGLQDRINEIHEQSILDVIMEHAIAADSLQQFENQVEELFFH